MASYPPIFAALGVAGPLPRWRGLKGRIRRRVGVAQDEVAGPLPRWRGLKDTPGRAVHRQSGVAGPLPRWRGLQDHIARIE